MFGSLLLSKNSLFFLVCPPFFCVCLRIYLPCISKKVERRHNGGKLWKHITSLLSPFISTLLHPSFSYTLSFYRVEHHGKGTGCSNMRIRAKGCLVNCSAHCILTLTQLSACFDRVDPFLQYMTLSFFLLPFPFVAFDNYSDHDLM